MADYYDCDNHKGESLGDSSYTESVSPGQIEGIHLGETEAMDSSVFWSQHKSDGSLDSFKEIASHIPEVQSQLDAGKTLSEIRSDPSLETCVSVYFEPANIPRVYKCDGYYEFEANGRHRILAARELGYDILVNIIGIRI